MEKLTVRLEKANAKGLNSWSRRWATSLQPQAKTKRCEAPHFQYHVSGALRIRMDGGTQLDCKPGDVSLPPSGDDAWVVGNEPAVVIDFQGMIGYAKSL